MIPEDRDWSQRALTPEELRFAPSETKRARFILEYLRNGRRFREAYQAAGYSGSIGNLNKARVILKHPDVARAIKAADEEACIIAGLTAERTLREVARIAYFDPGKMFDKKGRLLDLDQMGPDQRAVIASFEQEERYEGTDADPVRVTTKKLKFHNKNQALETAMKHLGLFEKDNEQVRAQMFAVMVPTKDEHSGPILDLEAKGVEEEAAAANTFVSNGRGNGHG